MQEKPLLYVDVDGVISLWGFDPDKRPPGSLAVVDGIPHFLSEAAGRHLLPGCRTCVSTRTVIRVTRRRGWKLGALEAHAGSRPLAWVDDAFNEACWEWARARAAPTHLVATSPDVGLVDAHAASLREWVATLR
jgi:hypothetical protein